jgi:hypothetical protein
MAIKAANIIVGGVEDTSVPQPLPILQKADTVIVANLQELRSGVTQPVFRDPRVRVQEEVVKSEDQPKKPVSKYLADIYNTTDLPSFDEQDK